MNKGYYITSKGKRVELSSTDALQLSNRDIIELVIPDGVEWVYCHYNYLKKLFIPKSVLGVYCVHNQITNLILPDNIKDVYCDLTALDINKYKNTDTRIFLFTLNSSSIFE